MSIVAETTLAYLPAKQKVSPKVLFVYKYTTRSIKGMFYLYVKTHNQTGLKYLGQTSRDPYNYCGSGTRWVNHLNVHGIDISTEILLETPDKSELSEAGIYYSNLYNIVEDDNWANIVEETGTGGDTSKSPNYIKSLERRDYTHRRTKESRAKSSAASKKMWREKFNDPNFDTESYKEMCSNRSKAMWKERGITEEDRALRSKIQSEYVNRPGVKESLSKKSKEAWLKKSKTYRVTFPDGHVEIVKSFRGWCKENCYPYYKLYNTIRNNRPSPDGWFVEIIED